jgi:hypothetical protein
MSQIRIEFTDIAKVPAEIIHLLGPFKNIRYEVMADGHIRLTIKKELDFMTYNINASKKISSLRKVKIKIFEMFNAQEVLIRTLNANFINYVLDERPLNDGSILREEIISWEVTEIL